SHDRATGRSRPACGGLAMTQHILIIGAGQAAVSCAARLRVLAPDCSITLVGEEPHLPYQRPPLSKAFLSGEVSAERLALKPQSWYEAQSISLKREVPVTHIDRQHRRVTLADGEQLA